MKKFFFLCLSLVLWGCSIPSSPESHQQKTEYFSQAATIPPIPSNWTFHACRNLGGPDGTQETRFKNCTLEYPIPTDGFSLDGYQGSALKSPKIGNSYFYIVNAEPSYRKLTADDFVLCKDLPHLYDRCLRSKNHSRFVIEKGNITIMGFQQENPDSFRMFAPEPGYVNDGYFYIIQTPSAMYEISLLLASPDDFDSIEAAILNARLSSDSTFYK